MPTCLPPHAVTVPLLHAQENILLKRHDDGSITVKVADFGLSTLMQTDEMLKTACGSPHYVAPEILHFNGEARYDGRESDVWSLGVILHVLLCYKLPFEAESTQLLYKKIRQGLPSPPTHLSPASQSLLRGMLEVQPERRMTLVQAVQHEWLRMQGAAPQLSQTVDAVVDIDSNWLADGSADFISASRLFTPQGGNPQGGETPPPSVRRAFTFDALPRTFSDTDLRSPTTGRVSSVRHSRGLSRALGGAASSRSASPRPSEITQDCREGRSPPSFAEGHASNAVHVAVAIPVAQ